MARHVLFTPEIPQPGETLRVGGEEAHHAIRVKRLESGDGVNLRNGKGKSGTGRIVNIGRERRGEWVLDICVEISEEAPRPVPCLEVWTGVPKGDRLAQMIESLSQVGAARWGPLESRQRVVDPREGKLARLARIAEESTKQCARAWTMEIADACPFERTIGPGVILADASGSRYEASGAEALTLLVGPEGGFTPEEIDAARQAGCVIASFGMHTMRIETAAVVAAAIVLECERAIRR